VALFGTGNIFLMLPQIASAGRQGTLASVVPVLLGEYALFHGLVALVCSTWAVMRLRRVALRQFSAPSRERTFRLWPRPRMREPMFWKEIFVEGGFRFNVLGYLIVILLVIATAAPGFRILVTWLGAPNRGSHSWWIAPAMNEYVRVTGTCIGCLLLVAVAIRASVGISGERDRQTLDALLATPLRTDTILWSKWLGSILSVRLGLLWLGFIYALGVFTGGLHLSSLPGLIAAWVVYAAVVGMIGLWCSLKSHSSLRATMATLFATVALSVGHWLPWLLFLPFAGGDGIFAEVKKFQFGLTPPAVLGALSLGDADFRGADFAGRGMIHDDFYMGVYCHVGIGAWLIGGLVFWYGVLRPGFRQLRPMVAGRIPRMENVPVVFRDGK
jgi:ABC-type transport system involved in multi-copper enzyme maturation permease subunit